MRVDESDCDVKLSVIVPLYNGERYIGECLSSILSNGIRDIEILVIDDGSTDKSAEIVKAYSDKDERIHLLSQKNTGVSHARNVGIELSRGEYITFVDADDWITDDMYKEMYNIARTNELDILICGIKVHNQITNKVKDIQIDLIENKLLQKEKIYKILLTTDSLNSMCNKLYRRKTILNSKIMLDKNISYGEDLLFNLKAFHCANKIMYINKKYYVYRKGHESATSNTTDLFNRTGLKLYNIRDEFKKACNINKYDGGKKLCDVAVYSILNEFNTSKTFKEKINSIKLIRSNEQLSNVLMKIDINTLKLKDKVMIIALKYNIIIIFWVYSYTIKIKKGIKR